MNVDFDTLPVVNNAAKSRFELVAGDDVAWIDYELEEGLIRYTHTEVPAALQGKGLGKKLAAAVMQYAEEHSLDVEAVCPVVAKYVKEHSEYHGITRGY